MNLPNRGIRTRNVIVLNKTIMPAILFECLFADSDDRCYAFDEHGIWIR
ncbi:N-acetylmuramoyl-L-alanine amidase [Clostridium sp. YIM B02569]|nr:N-acetylmuramoyl-L-alanine amidase [Clostridium sp. YIM B02569]